MKTRSKNGAVCAGLLLIGLLGGCGGSGGGSPSVPNAVVTSYSQTVVLGSIAQRDVGLAAAQGLTTAQIISSTASTLLASGSTPVVAVHRSANATGALIACVSAPTSSTGTVDGINLGVNVKSVAALMDSSWTLASDQSLAWATLAKAKSVFEGWENCGVKPEGLPSPASLRRISTDGSLSDDIYDGNPSTTLNIITLHASANDVAQMLSASGYLNRTQLNAEKRIWLRIYSNPLAQTVLVEEGLTETGSNVTAPGYLAVYFRP